MWKLDSIGNGSHIGRRVAFEFIFQPLPPPNQNNVIFFTFSDVFFPPMLTISSCHLFLHHLLGLEHHNCVNLLLCVGCGGNCVTWSFACRAHFFRLLVVVNNPFTQREIASISAWIGFVSESATFLSSSFSAKLKRSRLKKSWCRHESNVVPDGAKIYKVNALPLN